VGTGPAFAAIGVGNRGGEEGARESKLNCALIRQMSTENFVAKYMVKRRGPPRARVGLRTGPGAVTVDSITQRLIRDRPLMARSRHWQNNDVR
jgi:hypothetical protein